jgi:hypothetical protein
MPDAITAIGNLAAVLSFCVSGYVALKIVKIERLLISLQVAGERGQIVTGEKNLTAQRDISVR